jgi:hypothetical protein
MFLIFAAALVAVALGPVATATELPGLTVTGVQRVTDLIVCQAQIPPVPAPCNVGVPVTAYRWLVEEDKTYHVAFDAQGNPISVPGSPGFDANWENTVSVSFHKSYMPLVAKGCVDMPVTAACNEVSLPLLDPNKHYFVSVLPRSAGYAIGGVGFKGGGPIPTVYVNQTPLPTAQISIFVFPDTAPINGAPDTPSEDPATNGTDMSGFKIVLEDGGGRYGASAGIMSTDVYGNPLGTTYNPDGTVLQMGDGTILTGPDGWAHVYNLAQGKYGVQAVPPAGSGWVQTSTIEGTKIIDAWVKPNEPPFFAEFGPPGPHVFIGFTKEFNSIPVGTNPRNITGTVVNLHMSRPPEYAVYNGLCFGHTTPWVALNDLSVGIGVGRYAAPTDADCNFAIPNVPDGNYQLVVFDSALDLIIAFKGISISNGVCNTPSGECALGDVPVFQWFHRQEHFVYNDINGNGTYEPALGETPILEQAVNIRWRDGTIYQGNVSDGEGLYAFDQVFPFFSWLVAEVDFARFEATGLTVVVDNGGPIPLGGVPGPSPDGPDGDLTYGGAINPQDQTKPADLVCALPPLSEPLVCTETPNYRTELGPVLTAGFQGFIGQTSAFQWGKRHYADGENGGISGIVFYDVTRDVNDPEQSGAQVWEPGIPGVTVNLYAADGTTLLNATVTDSWDDSNPTGCKWGNDATGPFVFSPDGVNMYPRDCYDGLRTFNQVRPAIFDGGYAFSEICGATGGLAVDGTCPDNNPVDGIPDWISPMPVGDYVVEVVPPPGYELTKPEDKNVDFGDAYMPPTPARLPPPCVGAPHVLPPYLTLYPDEPVPTFLAWTTGSYVAVEEPLCDKKLVTIGVGTNAAADFFIFTEVPVAAHGVGFILDDTQAEFSPNAPNFGEKYAPPFMPISIRDWTGREIARTYSDQYGVYNFLAPSTSTTNVPAPSGMSPNMLTACMNDATLPGGSLDPRHNPIYSQFCYTFQYMPGVYTYLDTPVVPVGAFAGPDQFPVDCEFADKTPRIEEVTVTTNGVGGGPYIPTQVLAGETVPRVAGTQIITIRSMGTVSVPNPLYCNNADGNCPPGADFHPTQKVIPRNYGFGAAGTVTLGNLGTLGCLWGDPIICTILDGTPVGSTGGRQLMVTRTDGGTTRTGVTVQVGLRTGTGSTVVPVFPDTTGNLLATPLQNAIDLAGKNDLLLVHPGTYNEMVVMWKPVQLQGFGEGSTKINALKQPAEKLTTWRLKVQDLISRGLVNLLPGQEAGFGGIEQVALMTEEGAGVLVLPSANGANQFDQVNNQGARIDGFTITGADTGGGIVVNGYGHSVEISNNRISNNSGTYAGGIRVGHPFLTNTDTGVPQYTDGENDYLKIHHNTVNQNGALDGAGAGISMGTGADYYQVTQNWVCGNFNASEGGGIGHIGLSDGDYARTGPPGSRYWVVTLSPLIEDNTIIFNETFLQGRTVSGGGVYIGGAPPLTLGGLSPGAGNVVVNRNLIQGNAAGAGDGGGIRLARINGQDVAANPTEVLVGDSPPKPWYRVVLFNNMIVNNVAGLAGGGVSLQDAVKVNIIHDTIANNDSLGIAGEAFSPGNQNQANAQPGAGIVTRSHSTQLMNAGAVGTFSDPRLEDSIVWHNRKFFFFADTASGCLPADPNCLSTYGLCPDVSATPVLNCPGGNDGPVYDDLGAIGAGTLACDSLSCIDSTGANPLFVKDYINGSRSSIIPQAGTTAIQAPAAFDEGGNFINPRFGPLSLDIPQSDAPAITSDYHITDVSPAQGAGIAVSSLSTALSNDFDGEARTACPDIGADDLAPGGPRCLVSIAVTPTNPSIVGGATQQFTATGTYSDELGTVDLTATATWTSSNPLVATITNPGGLATGVSWGPTTIQATWEGVTGSTQLTVPPTLHFSTFGIANPPGVAGTADDADVYYYSGTGFSRSIDVTAITNPLPAATNVDGLVFVDATHFYMSFVANTAVPGLETVQDEDVVYYNAGTWSVWFDGTDPGLTANNQDLDAISIVGGTLYFSTVGNTNPPGVAGTADNADIYKWNGVGSIPQFTRVVDVTLITNPLPGGANVDGLVFVDATHFYMSFVDDINVPGLGLVQDEDVIYYNNGVWSTYFDGTAAGLTVANLDVDAFSIP